LLNPAERKNGWQLAEINGDPNPYRVQHLLSRADWDPDDPERGQQAGVPAERTFATKPELARQILERTFAAGVTFAAIAGDSVYGDDRALRQWLEARSQPYVLAISRTEHLWLGHESWSLADLYARLASVPWERPAAVRVSSGEIRHPFWKVVVAVAQPCAHILDWSWWRRCHQALSGACHCRRRALRLPPAPVVEGAGAPGAREQPAPLATALPEGELPAGAEDRP